MGIRKINVGTNDDGSPRYLYDADPGEHVLVVGPHITGTVVVDGKKVDVTPEAILVDSPAQALAISDAIGRRYEEEGHPLHREPSAPFVLTPSAVSHDADGAPSESFAEAVRSADTANGPQQVIAQLSEGV